METRGHFHLKEKKFTYLVMKFILYPEHDKSIFPENKTSLMVLLISQWFISYTFGWNVIRVM